MVKKIEMTLEEVMRIRHKGRGVLDNGGIWFDMKDFWLKTPKDKVKIKIID